MALSYTTYYGLARVSEMGPEVKGWAATDLNPQVIALLLKTLTLHKHGGTTPIRYPGYNYTTPSTPTSVTLTEVPNSAGVLPPGTNVGVRLSFLDTLGLETDGSPETVISLAPMPAPPEAPAVGIPVLVQNFNGMKGGTYVYAITKVKGQGETQVSSVSTIDVPFVTDPNTSYNVPITFTNINAYDPKEGIVSLKLYRAAGLTSDYQLVKTVTDPILANFTDTGTLEDSTHNPPTANTYDKNKLVRMNWGALATPPAAAGMRVYVTQQPGVYGTNQLLAELPMNDPTTPLPTIYNYLGSETLKKGWPKDYTQLPDNPPKLRLNSEATGAPILTEFMDFQGYEALNFVLPQNIGHSTPIPGAMYWDPSTNSLKIYRTGGIVMTLATPTGSYSHPLTEAGGHNAANIVSGAFNQSQVNAIVANTAAGQIRKAVQGIWLATPTTTPVSTFASASAPIPGMEVGFSSGPIIPDFAGQWVEFVFSGELTLIAPVASQATGTLQMEVNGSLSEGITTVRSFTGPANSTSKTPIEVTFSTPVSGPIKVRMQWWTTANSTFQLLGSRRTLRAKEIF